MIQKLDQKNQAIALRKSGSTYSEILKKVPVAKSTLSLWLRDVGLAKKQVQRITAKKRAAQKRGGAARKKERLDREGLIIMNAKNEIGRLSDRELWLIGIALYWAEGTKQKRHNVSQGVEFINDDYRVLQVYRKWLNFIGIPLERLGFEVYLHESSRSRTKEVVEYWTEKLDLPESVLVNVYFKRHQTKGFRRKLISDYFGSLRIRVRASTDLNRKITGWVESVVEHCQIV